MSWLYSRALVEEYLEENSLDGKLSARFKLISMPQAFLSKGKMKTSWNLSRYGMTYQHLTENHGKELLMWYQEVFLAKTFPPQEKEKAFPENVPDCGLKWRESLTKFNPHSFLWRTRLFSLFGDWIEFSGTWPRWGTMRNGVCWKRKPWELPTNEKESGSSDIINLFPTPMKNEAGKNVKTLQMVLRGQNQMTLDRYVRIFPTPCKWDSLKNAHRLKQNMLSKVVFQEQHWDTPCKGDAHPRALNRTGPYYGKGQKHLQAQAYEQLTENDQIGGQLNPEWVEWLMGWPIGWTASHVLETDKFQEWQNAHGNFSIQECFKRTKSRIRKELNTKTLI